MSLLDSPIPLSDIEDVLAWVDTFKLSRPTKKINRDFSDAVLLAEILSVHYPKLVEMHNYPPRNSHSLKLNNWMTLNRKVLKKLRLNLCCNTMEQLANCTLGVIERVLLMVRDKIRRDEEVNKSLKDAEQNMSSGGSYYDVCGDDENVLVVPVKTRVNGVLETMQKKVVSYEHYLGIKEQLKDAKDSAEMLKQKVEHLDSLIKLKEERIEELQKQLDRKQARRREVEANQNSISVPFEPEPPTPEAIDLVHVPSRPLSVKSVESNPRIGKDESKIPVPVQDLIKSVSRPSITEVASKDLQDINVDRIKSDVFKEVEIIDQRVLEGFHDSLEFINEPTTIAVFDEKQNNLKEIDYSYEINYLN
ncbi:sperm flagellar protein 1-like [Pararge aegeria]|uniref:Jg3599 protein n=1 Tax=Pararge aegeria aegeria TaxID=348720 RepID=A0A8S4R5Z8_9NEOP|nr:sperm flagellar protein 1-like [Pararge aegeria]CAH2231794.1 jg3599 [Pararge aegeria aegeria]